MGALVNGTLVKIWLTLTPRAVHERFDDRRGRSRHSLHLCVLVGKQPLDLLLVMVKHPPQVARQIAHVQMTITIAQHGLSAVITRHDDKATFCVKNVIYRLLQHACTARLGINQLQRR